MDVEVGGQKIKIFFLMALKGLKLMEFYCTSEHSVIDLFVIKPLNLFIVLTVLLQHGSHVKVVKDGNFIFKFVINKSSFIELPFLKADKSGKQF